MPVPDPGAAGRRTLLRCLAIAPAAEETLRLRLELLRPDMWEPLFEATRAARLTAPLAAAMAARGLVPPRPRRLEEGAMAPADALAAFAAQHAARREAQHQALLYIVRLLNAGGFEPILLKGARSLWLGVEPDRSMRDFDVLLPGAASKAANDLLKAQGFAPLPGAPERPNRHHLDLLFRDDMPGWIEIHRRGGNPYAEPFLPTREIVAASLLQTCEGARAFVLPDAAHSWHGLIHHHFGHSGFARGTVDLKGLYEFCCAYHLMQQAERAALRRLAARDATGLAALDLWLALGRDLLALPFDTGPQPDARAASAAVAERLFGAAAGIRYPGYRETIRLAWSPGRLAETGARGWMGGLSARMRAALRLLPKIRRE
ncbi:MAG: nucleotidyltransferase family protein [Mesorhizobium sp.]